MEKIKQKTKIEKKEILELVSNIFVFCFIFLFCFSNIFAKTIGDLDEMWNYNFARNIVEGHIPYNDFNMIQTPLLPFICAFFLKVIGNKLIIMRFLAVIMHTFIFYFGYEILKKHGKDRNLAIIVVIAIMILSRELIAIDYNYAVLLLTLIVLMVELKNKNNENYFDYSFKYNFLLGLLVGSTILLKQTTGIIISIAFIGYKLFEVRNKNDFKRFLKIASTRLIGILIPILLFMIYLVITKSFESFISYCILGIKEFKNIIEYKTLLEIKYIKLLAIVLPIFIVILFIFQFVKKDKVYNILFAYSLSSFSVVFPISDKIHFLIGAYISLISLSILLMLFINDSFESEKLKKKILFILTFVSAFLILLVGYKSFKKIDTDFIKVPKENELSYFEGIPENVGLKERIIKIENYILEKENEGKKVYILDAEAAIYYIPLNRYNKNYDMFLVGNLGKSGEDGIIEQINQEENAIYLMKRDEINWQTPMKVRDYIIDNFQLTDKISIFDVYEMSKGE